MQSEFGGFLEDAVRDRFVCGLKGETTQRKSLTESDLTFMRAVKVTQNDETAIAKAKLLQGIIILQHYLHSLSPRCTKCQGMVSSLR